MNLQPKDIEVSLVQADHEQNLGQWSVQTYSGVVLYHKPTGVRVECTKHKSQYKNKAEAMRMLDEQVRCKVSLQPTDSQKIEAIRLVIEQLGNSKNYDKVCEANWITAVLTIKGIVL